MLAEHRAMWRERAQRAGAGSRAVRRNDWVAIALGAGGRLEAIEFTAAALQAAPTELSDAIRGVHTAALRDLTLVAARGVPGIAVPQDTDPVPGGVPVGGVEETVQLGAAVAVPAPLPALSPLDPERVDMQIRAEVEAAAARATKRTEGATAESDLFVITVNALGQISDVQVRTGHHRHTAEELADDFSTTWSQALRS